MSKSTKAKNTLNPTADSLIRRDNQDSEHSLLTLVQAEIIPRLMLAHRDPRQTALGASDISRDEIVAFTQALLAQEVAAANVIVAELREVGYTIDAIYLQLLAPSARYLGELWEADTCNFSEVTLCLWRIQTMLYDLSPAFQSDAAQRAAAPIERRILIANLPGHQHTLGVSMLSEFFRREGWVTLTIPSPQPREIQDSLSMDWFDVLALSAGTDREIDDLQKTVEAARKTSRNPCLAIMVGGALLLRRPELVSIVGADGTADDADSALTMAANLVQHQREVRLN